MNTRQFGFFGLAALGLALAAPVQAAPDFLQDVIVVARNDRNDDGRDGRRDTRRDERRDDRRDLRRDDDGGYGYGYERRRLERDDGYADERRRNRR